MEVDFTQNTTNGYSTYYCERPECFNVEQKPNCSNAFEDWQQPEFSLSSMTSTAVSSEGVSTSAYDGFGSNVSMFNEYGYSTTNSVSPIGTTNTFHINTDYRSTFLQYTHTISVQEAQLPAAPTMVHTGAATHQKAKKTRKYIRKKPFPFPKIIKTQQMKRNRAAYIAAVHSEGEWKGSSYLPYFSRDQKMIRERWR